MNLESRYRGSFRYTILGFRSNVRKQVQALLPKELRRTGHWVILQVLGSEGSRSLERFANFRDLTSNSLDALVLTTGLKIVMVSCTLQNLQERMPYLAPNNRCYDSRPCLRVKFFRNPRFGHNVDVSDLGSFVIYADNICSLLQTLGFGSNALQKLEWAGSATGRGI